MFSPYYAWARRRGAADPADHVALNVALYGASARRWTMTERGRARFAQGADALEIGPSRVAWDGRGLRYTIDEIGAPLPRRVQGEVRVTPRALTGYEAALDADGLHRWRPIAPVAEVEVLLSQPRLNWRGTGYFDANHGAEPLERRLRRWDWSRGSAGERTRVIYDVEPRHGEPTTLALDFDAAGGVTPFAPPPRAALARSGWRIDRATRADPGSARLIETLEDTPFYARSLVASRIAGEPLTSVHESLDLDRYAHPLVQAMLPFRMPRRRG